MSSNAMFQYITSHRNPAFSSTVLRTDIEGDGKKVFAGGNQFNIILFVIKMLKIISC